MPGGAYHTSTMSLFYKALADLLVVLHAGYVLFVLVGLVLILVGVLRRWTWVRNFWFRVAHLGAILFVVAESLLGIECPLTTWEHALRVRADETSYQGDFVAHWVHEALFFELEPWVFTVIYTLFGLLVLATFLVAPPRRPKDGLPLRRRLRSKTR